MDLLKLLAKPGTILNLLPLLRTRSRDRVKDTTGIPLLPQLEKLRVVGAPEGSLPVRLEGISLVDVGSTVGTSSPETAIDDVGKDTLSGLLLRDGGVAGEGKDGDELVADVPEAGVDGAVSPLALGETVAAVPHVADEDGAVLLYVLEGVDDAGVVVGDVGLAEGPAAGQGGVTGDLGLEQGVVELVEGAVGGGGLVEGETHGGPVVEKRLEDSLELDGGLVDADDGVDAEGHAGVDLVVGVQAVVDEAVGVAVELGDGIPPEGLVVVDIGRTEGEGGAGAGVIVKGLVGGLDDDTESRRAATPESPEEVGVGRGVGSSQNAISSDDLELESGIGKEAVEVGQRTVATTLDETTSNTDSL